jgi:LysM repeat protein
MLGGHEKKIDKDFENNPNSIFALLGAIGSCVFVASMMLWGYFAPHYASTSSPHGSEVGHQVSSHSPSGRDSVSRNEQTVVTPSKQPSSAPSHENAHVTKTEPTPSPSAAPTPEQQVYVVQNGDTLSSISAATGVSVDRLAEANGIRNVHLIYRGSALVIPQP